MHVPTELLGGDGFQPDKGNFHNSTCDHAFWSTSCIIMTSNMDTRTFFAPAHPRGLLDSPMRTRDLGWHSAPARAYQAIWCYFSGDGESVAHEKVHPLYAFVRLWATILVPAFVGVLSLSLALLLARAGMAQIDRVMIGRIPLLVLLFLGGGTVFGYMLYFAEEEATWLATVVSGSGIFMAALLSLASSPLLGMGIIATSSLVLLFYLQPHAYKVTPATIATTQLFKRYLRTLPPGRHILLPGERVAATFDTYERPFISPTQSVEIEAQDGMFYCARAVALVVYAVDPDLAYCTLLNLTTWERDLHASIGETLQECLARWAIPMVAGENLPQDALAHATLAALRGRAKTWGIYIKSVRIRNIQLDAGDASDRSWGRHPIYPMTGANVTPVLHNTPTIAHHPRLAVVEPSGASSNAHSQTSPATHPKPAGSSGRNLAVAPVPNLFEHTSADTSEVEDLLKVTVSPDTLADTYQAIRERRITDPATIRVVAQAFADISQDPDMKDQTPYNAASAAHILDEYATRLAR